MQRITKYRMAIGTLLFASVGCAGIAFAAKRECVQLRDQVDQANKVADDRAKRALAAEEKLSSASSAQRAEQQKLTQAVGAFSQQAETCAALKEQLHIKD